MNRKTQYFLIAFLFSVLIRVDAQKHPQFQYISFEGGINLAGVIPEGQFGNEIKLGFFTGVSGNYSLSDVRSIGASLFFDQKGAADKVHDITTSLNYIKVPVYMKWFSGKDPRLYFSAGVYTGWLVSASKKGDQFIDGQHTEINENVTGNFNRFDTGLTAGVGLMIRLYDDLDFMVSAGGSAGLLDIDNNPLETLRNYQVNVSLGYIYYIGYR